MFGELIVHSRFLLSPIVAFASVCVNHVDDVLATIKILFDCVRVIFCIGTSIVDAVNQFLVTHFLPFFFGVLAASRLFFFHSLLGQYVHPFSRRSRMPSISCGFLSGTRTNFVPLLFFSVFILFRFFLPVILCAVCFAQFVPPIFLLTNFRVGHADGCYSTV